MNSTGIPGILTQVRENKRLIRIIQFSILVVLAVGIVALHSAFTRRIWIDEFLHFALAAQSPNEILSTIYQTTGSGVNHGQTGAHFLLDAALIKVFGASNFFLRLPSYIAGFILLLSAAAFMRVKAKAFIWQILVIIALGAQSKMAESIGDARPYIFLASTIIAALAYFSFSATQQKSWLGKGFGVFAILVGAIFHPYWLPLLMGVVILTWIFSSLKSRSWSLQTLIRHSRWRFTLTGIILYFATGSLTWIKGSPSFSFDPFEMIPVEYFLYTFEASHFAFLYRFDVIVPLMMVVTVTIISRLRQLSSPIWSPLLLVTFGLSSSVVFSAMSFLRDYWIIERQWVVGEALVAIGTIWLLAELIRINDRSKSFFLHFISASVFLSILLSFGSAAIQKITLLHEQSQEWAFIEVDPRSIKEIALSGDEYAWVDAANTNIYRGGEIDGVFRKYYLSD
ncbi:hypothetical protein HQ496_03155 [bacterium]|nr:hypothetical protein [bacterium]